MDISSMLGKNNGSKDAKAISVDEVNDDGGQFEALGDYNVDGQGHRLEFNPNETINTSDNAVVGDYNVVKPQYTDPEPIVTPSQPEANPAPTDDEAIDPAKMDFIKTYTREYDDTVASATHAVELILSAIDKTVHDHTNNIDIPEEALPFIDDKPKDNKVSKFDDAQQIVRTIMGRASEAKSQGEQAAMEASKIYDGIQQFKRDTKEEIASIRERDEFGRIHREPAPAVSSALPKLAA